MTLNRAFVVRLCRLTRNKISMERLVKESGLSKLAMKHLLDGNFSDVRLSSIVKVSKVLKMSLSEFFDDEIFNLDEIE